MKFAVPAVDGETRFLRRARSGALYRGEILRKDCASFQLDGTPVSAVGYLNRRAFGPEALPMIRACGESCARIRERLAQWVRREQNDEFQRCLRPSQHEAVFFLSFERRFTGPVDKYSIVIRVECAIEACAALGFADQF